jgi:hypothetical protein
VRSCGGKWRAGMAEYEHTITAAPQPTSTLLRIASACPASVLPACATSADTYRSHAPAQLHAMPTALTR